MRGLPTIATETRDLIHKIFAANPASGFPRIVAELAKLGIEVVNGTVDLATR